MTTPGHTYVTYFDQRFLPFALVTMDSLLRHDPSGEIFALCFDKTAQEVIARRRNPRIVVVSPDEIMAFEPRLAAAAGRDRWPYYATHKAVLPLYALARRPQAEAVLAFDADVFFYSAVSPLFDEIGGASIAVSPHRFSKAYEAVRIYGEFNAGVIYWRNDPTGRRCLAEWLDDCLEWCERTVEPDGRFMNQGYLTRWPQRYPAVHIIRHPGVNASWWNIAERRLTRRDGVLVDDQPLICFHFAAVTLDANGIWRSHRVLGGNLEATLKWIYDPFLEKVERTDRQLRKTIPDLLPIARGSDVSACPPVRVRPARFEFPAFWRAKNRRVVFAPDLPA